MSRMSSSLMCQVDHRFATGVSAFRISGHCSHIMGTVMPPETPIDPANPNAPRRPAAAPTFAQLYIYDQQNQLQHRQASADRTYRDRSNSTLPLLDPAIIADWQPMVLQHNPLARLFKAAADLDDPTTRTLRVVITANDASDPHRYNMPTTEDIAGIVPDNTDLVRSPHRDIVLRLRSGGLQHVNELHALYDAYTYPLLFPLGEEGWHPHLYLTDPRPLPRAHDDEAEESDDPSVAGPSRECT